MPTTIYGDDTVNQDYMISLTAYVVENREHIVSTLYEILASRTMTLVHGDMRSDNIFKKKGALEFCYIDWQGVSMGSPSIDMLQLMSASMTGM